jgi:hypothetical protein
MIELLESTGASTYTPANIGVDILRIQGSEKSSKTLLGISIELQQSLMAYASIIVACDSINFHGQMASFFMRMDALVSIAACILSSSQLKSAPSACPLDEVRKSTYHEEPCPS